MKKLFYTTVSLLAFTALATAQGATEKAAEQPPVVTEEKVLQHERVAQLERRNDERERQKGQQKQQNTTTLNTAITLTKQTSTRTGKQ